MSITGSLASNSGHLDVTEISQLLESSNLSVIGETVELVRDNLGSGAEPWLLNFLVDFYIQSGNTHARDLICMVRQHQHKALMNKIDEHLVKISSRLKALSLLNHIISNEPTLTHHILTSRAFQSVIKCLQVDTDLPTITAALYAVATIMPKVASQLSTFLPSICAIYVRLVSWHSIKPVGASEINLIHLHTAVYALFLCLYGMYPCYFMGYLQQYFQIGSPAKGNDKEKTRIFENSVSPMLDQVRLHPGLVVHSSNTEVSSERWRKLESQDILSDISKIALDVTENPVVAYGGAERKLSSVSDVNDMSVQMLSSVCSKMSAKTSRAGSDADNSVSAPEQSQETIWSPSIAIGLSTPPHSRAMSPAPLAPMLIDSNHFAARFDTLQKSESEPNLEETPVGRPLTLNMHSSYPFIPNRPHQTASATSTPLKHLLPSFLFPSNQTFSNSLSSSPQKDSKRKSLDQKTGEESKNDSNNTIVNAEEPREGLQFLDQAQDSINKETQDGGDRRDSFASRPNSSTNLPPDEQNNETFGSRTEPSVFTEFSPGLLPNLENPVASMKRLEKQESTGEMNEPVVPLNKLLNLKSRSKYIEKTPNELLDLHTSLVAEAYDKYRDKDYQADRPSADVITRTQLDAGNCSKGIKLRIRRRFPVTSNKEKEWQIGDPSAGQPTAEVMYLRSQVLQMHCAMLYERHRREQHALRARKLMRKVYDTTAMEEKTKTLNSQLWMKEKEIEECRSTVTLCQGKLQLQEENYKSQLETLRGELESLKSINEELCLKNQKLEQEKSYMRDECESMKTEVAQMDSKIFKLEHKLKIDNVNKDLISKMEMKIREQQTRLFECRETNMLLESRIDDARGEHRARDVESQVLIETYATELEALKAKYMKEQKHLDVTRSNLDQAEASIQKEKSIVCEQKKYLEDVKSLARGQIKAMEAKYNAQKHICQRLEIQVMELFSRLSAIEGEMAVTERTHLTSGPRSIQTLSALQSDGQYHHIYSSSPQLSPPMYGGLLAERSSAHAHVVNTSGHVTASFPTNSQQNLGN